jgi:hypothetical protein
MTTTGTTTTTRTAAARVLTDYRDNTTLGERRTVTRLLAACAAANYTVSVFDGEEWTVRRAPASAYHTICAVLATTGEDVLELRTAKGEHRVGRIYLVWGLDADGTELIADYTDTPEIADLININGL